ncbi:DOPA 4,5-dioxygenase family protein [Sphingomonas sp.]|uniref:DOPA 4,5-dioxygenase family protein n=1 Tax=Sphingomonas sp. TaxID=28214 RepID=UPI002DD66CED|nr:DOPA 4,5-dioxygenase family protein [Sphingomonas sp.]
MQPEHHHPVVSNSAIDQEWADLLSPTRRTVIAGGGLALGAAAIGAAPAHAVAVRQAVLGEPGFRPVLPPRDEGRSPWGYETAKETPARPSSIRPEGGHGLPDRPRPYTEIYSYHAHVYFDEDSYVKAAKLRQWVIERFPVELGNWNLEPRGPHVTPSFYFGFTNDLMSVVIPWLQLNSLGLTILLHPNSDDPRADHLHYTLWVNRSQPVNAFGMKRPGEADAPPIEKILPNITPTVRLEV